MAIFVFYLVENVEYVPPFKFRFSFSRCREEVKNVPVNQNPVWPSLFSDWPEKPHKLGRGR